MFGLQRDLRLAVYGSDLIDLARAFRKYMYVFNDVFLRDIKYVFE